MSSEYIVGWLSFDSTHMNLTNLDFPTNAEITDDESGSVYAEALALTGFAPVANVTTKAIKSMLDSAGLSGQCIKSGGTITQCDVIERRIGNCDSPLTATPHYRKRMNKALLRLGTLSASRTADATITAIVDAFSDGGGSPVAITDGVAQPTPIVSERYRLAVSKIAGVQFPQIENISLAFNVTALPKEPQLASVYPETGGVATILPELTLTGKDLSRVQAGLMELAANGATHANTVLQLKRIESGASFYGSGENQHISITLAGLAVPQNLASGSGRSRATNSIVLRADYDGVNAPAVFATSAVLNDNP